MPDASDRAKQAADEFLAGLKKGTGRLWLVAAGLWGQAIVVADAPFHRARAYRDRVAASVAAAGLEGRPRVVAGARRRSQRRACHR